MSLILVFCKDDILTRELPRPAMLAGIQAVMFRAEQLLSLLCSCTWAGNVTSRAAAAQGSVKSQGVFCLASRQ